MRLIRVACQAIRDPSTGMRRLRTGYGEPVWGQVSVGTAAAVSGEVERLLGYVDVVRGGI